MALHPSADTVGGKYEANDSGFPTTNVRFEEDTIMGRESIAAELFSYFSRNKPGIYIKVCRYNQVLNARSRTLHVAQPRPSPGPATPMLRSRP